ncbi:MAG: hypothetical protein LBH59_03860 [Planctomycetaceae bacterium]|nr:hypothetical protein [Planctomycetaceae bacterium]
MFSFANFKTASAYLIQTNKPPTKSYHQILLTNVRNLLPNNQFQQNKRDRNPRWSLLEQ